MSRVYNFSPWPDLALKKVTVPAGKSGDVTIKKFTLTEEKAKTINFYNRLSVAQGRHYMGCRDCAPGTYTGLWMGGVRSAPMMSDTPAEMLDHAPFVRAAHGDILITGLGIGLVIENLLVKANVKSITVVERSEDVIKLVAPHYAKRKIPVNIVNEDAFQFHTQQKFDYCWHDIWPAIDGDNLSEMRKLKRLYKNFCDNISCWAEYQCIRASR